MPQLNPESFPSQLFWLAVTFVVLYVLMAWVGIPRLSGVIEARRRRREDDLARAADMQAEAEAANQAFQRSMAEARAQAQAVLKETSDRLAAEAAERQARAEQVDEAERRIAATKQQALADVRGIAVDVGRSVVEKLTGAAPNDAGVAAAVDRVLAGPVR
ncbi:MAG TPA: F0F1 ATP synthase subunit B' [Stellaceae bacterium]|nr:F0F1 ATP synthase subunit B' [Stellaceae bacterium]